MTEKSREKTLRARAIRAAMEYYDIAHKKVGKEFVPGERIPYGGRIFDANEIAALVDSSLDFWLTAGRYAEQFEKKLSDYLGVRHCSLTNSGSSANLLAFLALTSPELGEKRIRKGDEVITVAAGFPTTVTPILQFGAVPVFIDVEFPTYNIDPNLLPKALTEKTRAVFLAHTLGNPFDLLAVREFCDRHGLWLIEDNCDALGSRYLFRGEWKYTGSIGHLGTSSFYPPHHITTGEGGAVYTDDPVLLRLVNSFRDWGRDCWCAPGNDNTCGNRFTGRFGELPTGFDHKYVYSRFGYNLKMTDMQAAIGCAQIDKLEAFGETRRRNFRALLDGLRNYDGKFILPEPTENSDPSWFGFPLTVREGAGFVRGEIVTHLETRGIQTRTLFAGNLLKHPCFDEMRKSHSGYRVAGDLMTTDAILERTFWVGVYPGLTKEMINYMIESIRDFASGRVR